MASVELGTMSNYEREQWARIQQWRTDQSSRRSRLPAPVREKLADTGELANRAWKAAPGTEMVGEVDGRVFAAGNQAIADAVAASLQRDRIMRAARATGAQIDDLADLRTLDLKVIDSILPSLNLRYAASSALTGAGSGFVAGGGTAAMVGTAGVAAAPGALAVGGALAADVVATVALASRVVTHYAGYCGYDTRREDEKAVLLAVIGAGILSDGAAKQAALLRVRQIAMMVARRAAWKDLGEETIVKLVQVLFARLNANLTKQKLGQTLPFVGIAAGAGLNYALMRRVGTTASFMYRERFLIDKYELDAAEPNTDFEDFINIEDMNDGDDPTPPAGELPM